MQRDAREATAQRSAPKTAFPLHVKRSHAITKSSYVVPFGAILRDIPSTFNLAGGDHTNVRDCGIAHRDARLVDETVLLRMTAPLRHRGPDDFEIWSGEPVGFAHTRLSSSHITGGPKPPTAHGTFQRSLVRVPAVTWQTASTSVP